MTGSENNDSRKRVSLAEIEFNSSVRHPAVCNPVPRSTPVTLSEVLLALRETPDERDRRIRNIFNFFDTSRKGYLDHSDIEEGFKALLIPTQYKYARDLLDVCDSNHDDRIDFKEFRKYMDDKEIELYSIFRDIDVKHHGCIHPEELRAALLSSGIELSDKELIQFVEHIDKDSNGIITFEKWRDFLLLFPHTATMTNIYEYWEKLFLVDVDQQAGFSYQLQAAKYFLAGGVAGALSRTATAPLDRLKVILQVQKDTAKGSSRILPCILKIYKEDGLLGFFRGNGINVIKVAPESAIKFYSYEMMKGLVVRFDGLGSKEDISAMGRLFAGGTAGAIAQTVIYPMDLVKTRLQTITPADGKAPPVLFLTKQIWQREGPLAFYRGLLPSLLGMIPYAGIDLAAYESLKNVSRQWLPEDHEPGPIIQLCCGMISGAVGATCVYPLQLVRTRMQAQEMNDIHRYKGMIDVFQKTYRKEGFWAFYKGLVPNLLKVLPAASITYIAYEEMKKQLSI